MTYFEREADVPQSIRDSVWRSKVHRLALLLSDPAGHDSTKLLKDKRTISLSDQLFRAAGAIRGDIEEGYSPGTALFRVNGEEALAGDLGLLTVIPMP